MTEDYTDRYWWPNDVLLSVLMSKCNSNPTYVGEAYPDDQLAMREEALRRMREPESEAMSEDYTDRKKWPDKALLNAYANRLWSSRHKSTVDLDMHAEILRRMRNKNEYFKE